MEITYTNKVIKMTGDEILEREERWKSWNFSRRSLWNTLTTEHYEGGHDAEDIYDCAECNERFAIKSVEQMCDDKTEREIMGDVSMLEHDILLRKFREKIKSMKLTFTIKGE